MKKDVILPESSADAHKTYRGLRNYDQMCLNRDLKIFDDYNFKGVVLK